MEHLTKEKPSVEPQTPLAPEEQIRRDRPSLSDWLDLRLGWWGFVRKNLDEPMPPGVGWWQTLGNLLLTLLMFQFITGFALMMYYTPSSHDAYDSVKFINENPIGLFVRGLHVWGSAGIVIATVLHVMRVFFWGSYKKPRELTWIFGVVIFHIILGFSFTGYLLPWDQKAYWATVVGTRIAATVPVIGHSVLLLIRGGEEVGALTLTRFFAAHVMLLPALLIAFTGLHLYLVRRHHIAGPVNPQKGSPTPFYPVQLFKDAVVVLGGLAIIVYFATAFPPALEAMADPSGTDFAPRPEWYFLGLYELLKIMPAGFEVVAAVIIPTLISGGMFLLPWIDRGSSRHPARRQTVIFGGTAVILLIFLLTIKGILETPPPHHAPPKAEQALALRR